LIDFIEGNIIINNMKSILIDLSDFYGAFTWYRIFWYFLYVIVLSKFNFWLVIFFNQYGP
jgi:hypothetical protein